MVIVAIDVGMIFFIEGGLVLIVDGRSGISVSDSFGVVIIVSFGIGKLEGWVELHPEIKNISKRGKNIGKIFIFLYTNLKINLLRS